MKQALRLSFLWLLLVLAATAHGQQWSAVHAIGTVDGLCNFSATQTPSQLVEIRPAATPNTGLTYQWEQATTPNGPFVVISGATSSSYSYTAPLSHTVYVRRKSTSVANSSFIYSNVVKLKLATSGWEDVNYLREHTVLTTGISTWQQADQLAIGDQLQTTNYMDGLGRSLQQVSKGTATPSSGTNWGDAVQFSQYDVYGREQKKYLPYTTTNQPGKLKTTPVADQAQYYLDVYNETPAYNSMTFDNSPVNRLTNIKESGAAWAASAGKSVAYDVNTASDNVQVWSVDYVQGDAPVNNGVYSAGSLYKLSYIDENGKKVTEYTNMQGQSVLRKVQIDDSPSDAHQGWACTYSVYDDFGRLWYELTPEAVKYLDANSWSFSGANGQKVLTDLCFQYAYDSKGRQIWKKTPGAEPLHMIYDTRDRLVFTQDGRQAAMATPEWVASIYDELDRPIVSTLYHTTKTLATLQSDAQNATTGILLSTIPSQPIVNLVVDNRQTSVTRYAASSSIEFVDNSGNGFESVSGDEFVAEIDPSAATTASGIVTYPYHSPISWTDFSNPSVCTILKYIFYDNYNFSGAKSFDPNFTNTDAYSTSDPNVRAIAASSRLIGFETGALVRVLGTDQFLGSTMYYDEKGYHIQSIEENIKSGKNVTTYQYHFDGRVLSAHNKHTTAETGYDNFSTLTKNIYDKLGRVVSIQKKYASNSFKTVVSYDYDDMSRIKVKHFDPGYTGSGKTELEGLAYSYNIHNNLTGINKDYALKTPGKYDKWGNFFGLYLGYDNADNVFTNARLNGQATGNLWNTQGDDAQRKYDFSYDNAGRLINAAFNEKKTPGDTWSHAAMDFSVSGNSGQITYDLNGNLLTMLQKGVLPGNASPVTIDDLQYTYASYSNKLIKVTDNTPIGASNGKSGDFKDGTNTTFDDYVYDANGNLVVDLNKNIQGISGVSGSDGIVYNFLDKPEQIKIAGKGTVRIVYSADGEKLQRAFIPETGQATVTTYVNQFVYQETLSMTTTTPAPFGHGGALSFINFEEGRIRVVQPVSQNNGYDALAIDGNMDLPDGKRGAYDYFITDQLANVRMILTEETHVGSNQCTMETGRASSEEPIFGQTGTNNEVAQTRFAVNDIPGQTTGGGWQNTNIGNSVSRIGNLTGHKTGPNTLLKVMAGDQISAMTQYYYQNPVTNSTGNNLVNDVIGSLLQSLSGSSIVAPLAKDGATGISTQLGSNLPFADAVGPDASNASGTNPKAYLTILFFDERFNFVSEGTASARVVANPGSNASLVLTNIKAPKNGYAYVYLSNESDEMVYFDNFQVSHNRGRIIEENHYYAFGLKIAAISSKKLGDVNEGKLDNHYQYQGEFNEMDDDLGWNDFTLRNYDPQIGRFVQQDPLQQFSSSYLGLGNDPVNLLDPSGGSTLPIPIKLFEIADNAMSGTGAALSASASIVTAATSTASIIANSARAAVSVFGAALRLTITAGQGIVAVNGPIKTVGVGIIGNAAQISWQGLLRANNDYSSSDDDWHEMYKVDLIRYAQSINYCTNCTANDLGPLFENLFGSWMRSESPISSAALGFKQNDTRWDDANQRTTVPDFTAKQEFFKTFLGIPIPGTGEMIEDGSIWEVKSGSKSIYLSSNYWQVKGHIDNLAERHIYDISRGFRPSFTLVTTYDVAFSESISDYCASKKIDYYHLKAQYRINGSTWEFKFVNETP